MPYISKNNDRREKLRKGKPALNAGELNYQIFYNFKHNYSKKIYDHFYKIIKKYVDQFLGEKPNYQRYNDMTGALIRCYKEIKRRIGIDYRVLLNIMDYYDDEIADYEDDKIAQNGDVEWKKY